MKRRERVLRVGSRGTRPSRNARSERQAARVRPEPPQPLDPPMVPFAVGGMLGWALAGGALLLGRDWLTEHGRQDWLWICLAGFLLGVPGLLVMRRHDARRTLRR